MNQTPHHQDLGAKWAVAHRAAHLARDLAGHPEARLLEAGTRELQILKRTPDQVIKVWHPNHGECLYLIEIQKRIDRRMAQRIAVESLALHQQTDLPVAPVVLYTGKVGKKRPVRYEVDGMVCHVPFREIVLAEQDAAAALEQGVDSAWWPFIPYMKGGNTRSILEPMLHQMADKAEHVDLLHAVLFMARDVLEIGWVRQFLEGSMWDKVTGVNLRKGTLHYYLREKWVGEGEARGMAQGEVIGELRMVKRAIARRFDMPDPELGQRLETLNTEQLEALNETLFDMTSREDLVAWLDREQA